MLTWFQCPDGKVIPVADCLKQCRMANRCATRPYLHFISKERVWSGIPSTTQLLNGTMQEFLKLTQPYAVTPDSRAFSTHGSLHHEVMELAGKELNLITEVALTDGDRDIFDLLEPDDNGFVLTDYKTYGSYRVAKALGLYEAGKMPDPNGEVYKVNGKWGKAGSPKMVSVWKTDPQQADLWDVEMQMNRYRIMLEEQGMVITKMQVQVTVRDGSLAVATSRGITRNIYMLDIRRLDDEETIGYFDSKEVDLLTALEAGKWSIPCNDKECWEGNKCAGYCEVALHCPKGLIHLKEK